jgi:DNA modification methylase
VWTVDMNELRNADFYEHIHLLKKKFYNLIILDPPWGVLSQNNYNPDVQWDKKPSIADLGEIGNNLLDPFGYVVVFGNRKFVAETEHAWKHIFSLRDELIWAKPSNIPTTTMKPLQVHEKIHIYMRKGLRLNKCTWNPRVLPGDPYLKKGNAGIVSTRRQIKSSIHENVTGMRHLKSVIYAPNKPAMKAWEKMAIKHPTIKPVSLLIQLIRAYTNPGDNVLDPFGGSASSSIASWLTGRHSQSWEIDSMWFQESIERFKRLKDMLGPGQVQRLIEQPDLGIDEVDPSTLFS